VPWELGLAETQQVLMLNGLRDRIVVQVDGQLKTGRDVVVAALLGAEEFGFATAPLVVSGCIMMRVCHLEHLPGRRRDAGPGAAQEVHRQAGVRRELLPLRRRGRARADGELGFRTLDEMVGRVDGSRCGRRSITGRRAASTCRASSISRVAGDAPRRARGQDHGSQGARQHAHLAGAAALERRSRSRSPADPQRNRTVGTMLGSEVTRRYGAKGCPTTRSACSSPARRARASARSCRAASRCARGRRERLLGQGLSGGKLVVYPPRQSTFAPDENVIVGNVALYGATSGEAYVRGIAGERFAVRNSGATRWSKASAITAAST
jgi:glutamate synthase (ferredoxin)